MNRTLARFALFALACLISLAHPVAQQGAADPWYGRQAKPQNMDPPKEFTGVFRIELPKNWQLAPGHTGTIFSVVEKTKKWETGGLISLEYQRLQIPLDPPMIAGAVTRQLSEVQLREASGKQFSSVAKSGSLGPFIFIQYDRPGVSGGDDHVAQYRNAGWHDDVSADLHRAEGADRELQADVCACGRIVHADEARRAFLNRLGWPRQSDVDTAYKLNSSHHSSSQMFRGCDAVRDRV